MVGDFLFAQALNKMILLFDLRISQFIARVRSHLSKGELLDIQLAGNHSVSLADYFRMISDKTASLFAAACQIGALSFDTIKPSVSPGNSVIYLG